MDLTLKPKPRDFLSWNKIEEHMIVVDDQEGKVYQFNLVGSKIWEEMDGRKTIRNIVQNVSQRFDQEPSKIEKDTIRFLDQLYKQDLISMD